MWTGSVADLRTFLLQYLDKPMQWGVDDCSLILADWWALNHGTDPAAFLRGTYANEDGKRQVVDAAGGLVALVGKVATDAGAERTSAPREGDFGVVRVGEVAYAAICAPGGFWAIRSPTGITFTRDVRLLRAWSLGVVTWPWVGYVDGLAVPHHEDPLSIGIAFLVNIGYTGAISGLGATIVGSAILGAVGLGLSFVSGVIFQRQPSTTDPQQRQATVRQSIGPRLRFYGRVKVAGSLWFFENRDGWLYTGITLNEGKIAGIAEYWLNDDRVDLDADGFVITPPYIYEVPPSGIIGEVSVAKVGRLLYKDGDDNQTVYGLLRATFPDVITDNHRLRGVATLLSAFNEVPSDKIGEVYPQLNPKIRVVMDASIVKSVRTGLQQWSDNPLDAVYDYLTNLDSSGFARGAGFPESLIDLPSFQALANLSDQPVPLKAGGTVKRYRLWGGYALNQKMRDVLPPMLATFDGDLYLTSGGKIAARGGSWVAPALTLDDQAGHIISHEFGRGTGALAAFNELTVTYTEPNLDYQEAEAQRWLDVANVDLLGSVVSDRLDLQMVPNHSQARRLAKIHTAKNNPRWSGRVVTNFYGFNAIGERMVRVKIDVLGIDDTFLVRRLTILPDMTGVELQITSLSESAYSWDAALEEGTAPGQPPDTSTPVSLDPPADINVSVAERVISGGTVGAYLVVTWTEPSRAALSQQVQYQVAPDGAWIDMSVSETDGLAQSSIVDDGVDYNVRVRTRSPAGAYGLWSDPVITITATPDTTTPDVVTALGGTAGTIEWTLPVQTNTIGARVYRGTVNIFGSATLIATLYGSPGTSRSITDAPPPGTYYYWVTTINGSGGESAASATGARVII